jgi:hypothetical protein
MHTEIITDPPILDGCHGLSVETPGWSVGLFGGRYLHPKHHPQHAQVTWGSRLLHQNYKIIQTSESKKKSYRRSYKNLPWDCHLSHARHVSLFLPAGGLIQVTWNHRFRRAFVDRRPTVRRTPMVSSWSRYLLYHFP